MAQQLLFAQDCFEADEVQRGLAPILPLLWQGVMEPWGDYRRRVSEDRAFAILPPTGVYQWLHWQIVDRIQTLFEDHRDSNGQRDARTYYEEGIFVLCYKELYEISFNKVDENYNRSSSVTRHNHDYWEQRLLPGIEKTIKLLIGYRPIKENTEIEIVVTAPRPYCVAWLFLVPDQTEALIRLAELQATKTPEPERKKRFRVKPKKDVRKRGEQ